MMNDVFASAFFFDHIQDGKLTIQVDVLSINLLCVQVFRFLHEDIRHLSFDGLRIRSLKKNLYSGMLFHLATVSRARDFTLPRFDT